MAGSSNFLQHNPSAANQENDATYNSDTTRTGGIGVDQILPSVWLNKVWFQASTFIAALANVIANFGSGYTITDTSISALETQLTNFFAALAGGGFTSGSNSNGTWVKDPTGTITQRGSISVSASGTLATGNITFPTNFTTSANLSLVVSAGNSGDGSGTDCMTCYYKNLTIYGAEAVLRGAVDIGGSGISGLSNPVPITWIAIGS
jgi:hypothetical protein